ncbi:MAG: hypothetical protein MJE68_17965, partial [Proteobacteria bacterium]|nr:hypothetical protein [Pseudomonadota bacterium]
EPSADQFSDTLHFCSVLKYEAVQASLNAKDWQTLNAYIYKLMGMTSLLHTSDSCSDLIGHFSSKVT